jgi:hypothetical protein
MMMCANSLYAYLRDVGDRCARRLVALGGRPHDALKPREKGGERGGGRGVRLSA